MSAPLPWVVLELSAPASELVLGVFRGQQRVASLAAGAPALATLHAELAMDRQHVRAEAVAALALRRDGELPAVLLTTPLPATAALERFASLYFHTVGDHTVAGGVWFDVASSMTGPASVPNPVRNHVRYLVNRSLAGANTSHLVEALLRWDAARLEEVPASRSPEAGDTSVDDPAMAEPARPIGAASAAGAASIGDRLSDAQGSVIIGWLAPRVLYARFEGAISLRLGQKYVERLRALLDGQNEVSYFTDYSAIAAYDVGVFPIILATLQGLRSQLERITARPCSTLPTAAAQARLDTFDFLEFASTAEEFEARLRAAAPGAIWRKGDSLGSSPSNPAPMQERGATPPEPAPPALVHAPFTYAFHLGDFESGEFVATRYAAHCAVRPRGAWICVAQDDDHALLLARRAAVHEWVTPKSRRPGEFTVRFLDALVTR